MFILLLLILYLNYFVLKCLATEEAQYNSLWITIQLEIIFMETIADSRGQAA